MARERFWRWAAARMGAAARVMGLVTLGAMLVLMGPGDAAADPPPFDPQNPYLLEWGRGTPNVDPGGAGPAQRERPLTPAEKRAEAFQAEYEAVTVNYDAGRELPSAAAWFKAHAEKGHAHSQFLYAECLHYGRGVAVDFDAALRWYRAAEQNYFSGASEAIAQLALDRAAAAGAAERRAAEAARAEADRQEAAALKGDAAALAWWREAAARGAADATRRLGRIEAALGHDAEAVKALRALEARGELAPADEVFLAEVLTRGKVRPARGEVLALYAKAEAGGQVVWGAVAALYFDGKGGVAKSAREGLRVLEMNARNGDVAAMIELGRRYEQGAGVERSMPKALAWYAPAGVRGAVAAGRLCEAGAPGLPRDTRRAAELYREAYEQSTSTDEAALTGLERMNAAGNVDGQAAFGLLAHSGQLRVIRAAAAPLAVVKGYYEAVAAQTGPERAEGQYALGVLAYWAWLSSDRDGGKAEALAEALADARKWFGLAADAGYPAALYRVGRMRLDGRGEARDPAAALGLFRRAAARGHAESMFLIGSMIESKEAGPVDLGTARSWYERAAAAGSYAGANALRR